METIDDVVEALHAHFAAHPDARCLLVVDPSLRALRDRADEDIHFSQRAKVQVAIYHDRFPVEHQPYLIELDSSRYHDALLLRESVRIALEDREPDSMRRGHGQRIGGWITSTQPAYVVAAHLSRLILQRDERGKRRVLRLHDSRVLALFWPLLQPAQQGAMLGASSVWHALSASAELTIYRVPTLAGPSSLALTEGQWKALHRFGAINAAMAEHMARVGRQISREEVGTATAAAQRAEAIGVRDEQDQIVFIGHALAWHPSFDSHPAVRRALAEVTQGRYYNAAIEKITPADIESIQRGSWTSTAQGV